MSVTCNDLLEGNGMFYTYDFVTESNRIEDIHREPTDAEIDEHERFIALDRIAVADLEQFVSVYQPDARLRDMPGLNVRVGNHYPPPGGPEIRPALEALLTDMSDPYTTHVRYETLHPFTDGNGRSGRALWAWQMMNAHGRIPLGFLHTFYYQSLSGARLPSNAVVQRHPKGGRAADACGAVAEQVSVATTCYTCRPLTQLGW